MFLLHWPAKKGPNEDCVIWLRHCFINASVCYARLMLGLAPSEMDRCVQCFRLLVLCIYCIAKELVATIS